MRLPCAPVAKPSFLCPRPRSRAPRPGTPRPQKRPVLTVKAVRLSPVFVGKRKGGKVKARREVNGWLRRQQDAKCLLPVLCFGIKLDLQRDSRLCLASKTSGGHQGDSPGGRRGRTLQGRLTFSSTGSSSSFHRPAEQCWTQISGPVYVPLKRGPGPLHTVI